MTKDRQPIKLTEKVNELLSKSDFPATLTIEQCALKLAMSMTSFRRKLTQEETTFKLIHSKYLNELCVKALLTNSIKIEGLAIKLGYSERATFERTFRKKFGITPSQFRELSLVGKNQSSRNALIKIAQNMPPMPDSCQQILREKDHESLDLEKVISIVEKDPILVGRIMGLASRAIYGKTPMNIHEAISRNLGINTVFNLALIYAVKDALQVHVDKVIIDQYTHAFLMAPKLFQLIRRSTTTKRLLDCELVEQVLFFSLLGVFLLSHKNAPKHELMLYSLQGMTNFHSLNHHINQTMDISIFSASSLMLSLWHIDAGVIRRLTHLDKVSQLHAKGSEQDELVLFMLSCLHFSAAGHQDFSELEQKAELLGISGFTDVRDLLSE